MTDDLELHLVGVAGPTGEIRARDLAVLAVALQELRLRIGREVIKTPGPGRTKGYMEELTELRLSSVGPGSTVLTFAQGPTDKLEGVLAEERQIDERFREIVEAMGRDERPEWASDLIADSAAKLVDGLKAAAPTVTFRSGSAHVVTVQTGRIHREIWTSGRVRTEEVRTTKGRLERVDLRSHEFRVRDDVGNAVDLRHVEGDVASGKLIGQWVEASGTATFDSTGRLIVLDGPEVEAVQDPAAPYVERPAVAVADLLAEAPGPDPAGAIDLDADELEGFLEAASS